MDKKYKIIGGICGAVCIGGIAAGIFFVRGTGEKEAEELAYVMSVSSMNDMSGTQRLAGVVESQKTLEIQKDSQREVKEVLVKAGEDVEVGTPLFTYDTASLEMDIQQARLDLERTEILPVRRLLPFWQQENIESKAESTNRILARS